MRFSEDIYVYEWTNYFDNNCNSYYIGGGVQALIDPGLKKYLPDLLRSMEEDGISREDIRYVINTHSHPDHYEGSAAFSDSGVKIGLHEEEIRFLESGGSRLYDLFGLRFPDVTINLTLQDGDVVLGDETFQILLLPGHSPGSLGLYWPGRKALFSGDVIFDQNVGRSDFQGGDGELLKKSIRSLSKMDVESLFPGHMGVVDGGGKVRKNFEMVIKHIFPYI